MSATIPTPFNLGRSTSSSDPLFDAEDTSDGGVLNTSGTSRTGNTKVAGGLPSDQDGVNLTVDSGKAGTRYYFNSSASTLDFTETGTPGLIILGIQANAGNRRQLDTFNNEGISIKMFSGTNVSNNIREWVVGGSNKAIAKRTGIFLIAIDPTSTGNIPDIGIYNPTKVKRYGQYISQANMVGPINAWWFWCSVTFLSSEKTSTEIPRIYGVSSSWEDLVDEVQGTTDFTGQEHIYVEKIGDTVNLICPICIGNASQSSPSQTTFNDMGLTVTSPQSAVFDDPRFHLTDKSMRFYLDLRNNALDTAIFSGTYNWGTQAAFDFSQSNNASITLNNPTFNGMGEFTCGSSVIGSANFDLGGSSKVIINGANLNGSTINGDVDVTGSSVTTFANLNVTGTLDFDTAGTYTLDGSTINEITNSSGGNITVILLNGATVTTNSGPNITLNRPVDITASNIIDGSRVQLNNITKSTELDNSVVSGGSGYSLTVNLQSSSVDIGDVIELKAAQQSGTSAKVPLQVSAVLTSSGLSFINSQENLTAYSSLGIDGSTVTEYNIDSNTGHLQIDANDSDCESTKKRIVARYYHLITLEDGIDRFFNAIILEDEANAVIDRSITTLMLDNIGNCTLNLTDNQFRLYTSDNSSWIQDPPTGGYGVISDSGKVYAVNQDQIETLVNAIKAKTDLFTFTGNDVKATLDGEQVVASNMRGTDGANTVSPDNAGISQIQTDISNLNDVSAAEIYTEFTSGNNEDAFKADVSSLATEANATANTNSIIGEVNANEAKLDIIDTNVDSILEDTNTTIPNQISGLNNISTTDVKAQADQALTDYDPPTKAELDTAETNITNAIPTVGNVADAVWDEPYNQHTTAGSFGKLMDLLRKANRAIDGEVTGTPTVSSFSTNLTGYTNGAFDHELMIFVSGTLNGEARPILAYSSGTFTFEEQWTQAPSVGDEFVILPYHTHPISEIQEGLSTFDSSTDVVQNVDTVQTTISNSDMRGTDGANTVTPPSVNDIQNGLAKRSELNVINEGVKKASKIIPHNTDI